MRPRGALDLRVNKGLPKPQGRGWVGGLSSHIAQGRLGVCVQRALPVALGTTVTLDMAI